MDGMTESSPNPLASRRCVACDAPIRHVDPLTGLADRREFRARLEDMLTLPASSTRKGADRGVAVLLLDLDRFKAVNDSLGHPAGDALLCKVAGRLNSALRQEDMAARLGGDEFGIILERPVDEHVAATVGARLVDLISRPYMIDGSVANIGASVGIALASPGMSVDEIVRHADLALYKSKSEGRGRVTFFEPGLQKAAEERRSLEFDLRAALVLDQFELFYQPKLDLGENRLTGFEALIRWRHPVRGLVPPDGFVPMAEELGLMTRIGDWVLRAACAEAAGWPEDLTVAVNVSSAQFSAGSLVTSVTSALSASDLPASRLELEVTENVLLRDGPAVLRQLTALKTIGVKVALDDFGTGYSSLTQLRSFPFDRVKIDRSFADDAAVVRAVAALGVSLGLCITAEGVETAEQMMRLRADGCTEAQGYHLSRPVPSGDVDGIIGRYLPQPRLREAS